MGSISSLTVTINVALDSELMIASLLANDKDTHTSSCASSCVSYSVSALLDFEYSTSLLLHGL